MYFSTEPIVTESKPFSITQLPSHSRSLGANAATDLGQVVRGRGDLIGLFDPAFGDELQPIRNVVRDRAMDLAEGDPTLGAAAGLFGRAVRIVFPKDFLEVLASGIDVPLIGGPLAELEEFQHALRHGRGHSSIR